MERNYTLPIQRMIWETKYNGILKSQYSLERTVWIWEESILESLFSNGLNTCVMVEREVSLKTHVLWIFSWSDDMLFKLFILQFCLQSSEAVKIITRCWDLISPFNFPFTEFKITIELLRQKVVFVLFFFPQQFG